MGQQRPYTSSGSKSRDTRGAEPSQDDVRKDLKSDRTGSKSVQGAQRQGGRASPGKTTHH